MNKLSPVCAWNEWDPLEEVIVGRADFGCDPEYEPWFYSQTLIPFFGGRIGGVTYSNNYQDKKLLENANKELENLARVLKNEGVTVKRPDVVDWKKQFKTPHFSCETGLVSSCPRDVMMVVGDEIIESNMAWRCRHFEYIAYRNLITEYFKAGAKWTFMPKSSMDDDLYCKFGELSHQFSNERETQYYEQDLNILKNHEPVMDAADCMRFGKDIFVNNSLATNNLAIEWLRQHLKPKGIRVHKMKFKNIAPMHVDDTLVPIRPGVVISSYFKILTEEYKQIFTKNGWKVYDAPLPAKVCNYDEVFNGINTNFLSLDEKTIIAEKHETETIKFLEDLGCKVIPVPMKHCYDLGGSIHCATCDIRRRGKLQSYFPLLDKQDEISKNEEEKQNELNELKEK